MTVGQTKPATIPEQSSGNGELLVEPLAHAMSQPIPSVPQGTLEEQATAVVTTAEALQHAIPQQGETPVDRSHPEDSEEAEQQAWEASLPKKPRRSKPADYVGKGRPSKFRRWMLPLVTRLAARNCTDADIAERLRVDPSQFSRWKRDNSAISQALAEGREMALDYVERALLKRAVGWVGPTEKVLRDGRVVRHKQFHPPDTAAAMHVLTNRRGDRWKQKLEGNQGPAMQVIINSPRIAAALARHTEKEISSVPQAIEEQE